MQSPTLPDDKQLEELAESVQALRARVPDEFAPVVVEFAGSPKSGKTTTIDIVSHFFKRTGFSVYAPSEGASKRTPYHLRRDLVAFNSWTLNYAISELLVAYHNVDRPHLIFLDRGPFDSLAWMQVLRERGKLSADEYGMIRDFALLPMWADLVSRLYLFTCATELSLEREHESKLITAPGTAMNRSMLDDLLTQYTSLREELSAIPVAPFETSRTTTPKKTSYEVALDVRELFAERLA